MFSSSSSSWLGEDFINLRWRASGGPRAGVASGGHFTFFYYCTKTTMAVSFSTFLLAAKSVGFANLIFVCFQGSSGKRGIIWKMAQNSEVSIKNCLNFLI
jgi:hypothetical protein